MHGAVYPDGVMATCVYHSGDDDHTTVRVAPWTAMMDDASPHKRGCILTIVNVRIA